MGHKTDVGAGIQTNEACEGRGKLEAGEGVVGSGEAREFDRTGGVGWVDWNPEHFESIYPGCIFQSCWRWGNNLFYYASSRDKLIFVFFQKRNTLFHNFYILGNCIYNEY